MSAAHAHARNAAALSQGPNLNDAREEHELAAQDFAKARTTVGDSEALRILDLLEHHHQQLAEIIKSQSAPKKEPISKDGENATDDGTAAKTTSTGDKDALVPKLVSRTSTSPVRTRRLHRETSSSIADNLARQRRGLPAAAQLSDIRAGGKILSHIDRPGYNNRQRSPESTRNLPPVAESRTLAPAAEIVPQKSEDNFSKFYNTFEGLFSKLSGPLAFAGLPLTPEQAAKDASQEASKRSDKERSKEKTRATSSDEPDLAKIYSAAALKAIREDVGPSFGPQESFYLVPPTGGTMSYAGMAAGGRASVHSVRNETIEEADDEFVDARESIGPPSPRSLRNSQRKGTSPSALRDGRKPQSSAGTGAQDGGVLKGGKTSEELELEISVLKQLLDTQAKRLQMWEMSSQSQSMALQQSIRAVRQRPDLPTLPTNPSTLKNMVSDEEGESESVVQLKALLENERRAREEAEKKGERLERENGNYKVMVGRYRDKWEQLKAGARRKEEEKRRKTGIAESEGAG